MMPAYSFSHIEFVPKILDGSKPHTIRPRRRNPTKPGDLLTLYYKQRTPVCRAIALTVCTRTVPVVIYPFSRVLKVNGRVLKLNRVSMIAIRDGFANLTEFFIFFERYKRQTLDDFELVEWDSERLLDLWSYDLFQEMVRAMSAEERMEWLNTSEEIGNALEMSDVYD